MVHLYHIFSGWFSVLISCIQAAKPYVDSKTRSVTAADRGAARRQLRTLSPPLQLSLLAVRRCEVAAAAAASANANANTNTPARPTNPLDCTRHHHHHHHHHHQQQQQPQQQQQQQQQTHPLRWPTFSCYTVVLVYINSVAHVSSSIAVQRALNQVVCPPYGVHL
eukprot:COSAG05_NODE_699_length_7868_cov_3.650019_3_plen_165_part_00